MKREDFITFRVDPETMKKLQALAQDKEWTLSHLVYKIVKEYFKNRKSPEISGDQ